MRLFSFILLFTFTAIMSAQDVGSIAGSLTDKDYNNEPLPFANVLIAGTTKGTTTDFDGNFLIDNVPVGTYTIEFSFVGYETLEVPNVVIEPNKVTNINTGLSASAAALDEVIIQTTSRRESAVALLLEQKKAVQIKESIGAQQLTKQGVSDAAAATAKISGVSKSEASGDIFVRGLGDRYLYTTMNGLPIPSDDVERKNIDLGLFSTRVLESLSISKTYDTETSADQASGNVDITSKSLSGQQIFSVGVASGINTNAYGERERFAVTANQQDYTLGFYTEDTNISNQLIDQTWNPGVVDNPINYNFNIQAGKRFGDKVKVFFTGSQSTNFQHQEGVFREYRNNVLLDTITDASTFKREVTTNALLDVGFNLDTISSFKFTSLFVNKLSDNVFEGGRNGEAAIFEETDPNEGLAQFIRDQNTRQTRLIVNQLFGEHRFSEKNTFDWGVGYNLVDADEPNRIRNEVNFNDSMVQLGRTGGFQQRKSSQEIDDQEINGFLKDVITFLDTETDTRALTFGANYRNKQRDFQSKFFGVEERTLNSVVPPSIDDLGAIFTQQNFDNGVLQVNDLPGDFYDGNLQSYAGFLSFNYARNKFSANVGVRYQKDQIDVNFDVGNFPGRIGESNQEYDNFYPSVNLKYSLTEDQNLRLASSKTITLPEFKEIAPFEYVSPTNQVTRGNPNIEASNNYNIDLKYEWFPSRGELLSITAFYKLIEDPINKVQDRGSAGVFSFFNAGSEANIYGIEIESRFDLISPSEAQEESQQGYNLALGLNATYMEHTQDLKEIRDEDGNLVRTFQFNNMDETGLQGASDFIFNGSLNFTTNNENPLDVSVVANYASDKIFAIGAPETQTQADISYNDNIVEEGFVTLDAVVSKQLTENWSVRLTGRNILNPEIRRTQNVRPQSTGVESKRTVRSYDIGSVFTLGVTFKL